MGCTPLSLVGLRPTRHVQHGEWQWQCTMPSTSQCNNVIYYIEVVVRKDCASAASCVRRSRTPSEHHSAPAPSTRRTRAKKARTPQPKRRWISEPLTSTLRPPQPPKCHSPRAGGFPKAPAPTPPCVFRSPEPPSARAHSTREGRFVWCFCRPLMLFSAIGAHGISSITGPLPVPSCPRSHPFRLCSTHWVWRLAA
jgi:hypothetical protein